ncbi:TetR/AcrR family transcriptional regulator [Corynebacterium xerosis]|uniref:TetR/AcrR family transcriptional regulator n=1 Tax=Corynebacterium xerosis TaxID=1725 RepID=UPI00366BE68E
MPRSTNTTSQRDRAAMTEKILDAAEHLLRRDVDGTGIPPLTLGDVAKEVGLARPSLYRYYAGVEDLIEAVSMRGFDEWVVTAGAEVRAARESSGPRAGIRAFVESNLRRAPGGDLRWRHQLLRVHLDEAAHRRAMAHQLTASDILVECIADLPDVDGIDRGDLTDGLRLLISGGVLTVADQPHALDAHIRLFSAAADAMIDEALGA